MKRQYYYNKIFEFALIIMVATEFYNGSVRANVQEERRFEIKKYKIGVKIPDTYDRIDVSASLDIRRFNSEGRDELNIILCKDFIGVSPVRVRVKNGRGTALDFIQDDDVFQIKLPDRFYEEKTGRVQFEYSLIKNEEYEKDTYSSFAFEVSDSLCHINAAITRTDNWYPKIEGTMHDRLPEFILSIDVASKFEVMASGKLDHVKDNKTRKIFEWHNYPEITDRSLYFFIAEQKRIVKTFSDGFKVIMYIPDNAFEENLQYISDVIYKSFRFFETKFRKIPGDEYKIMAFKYGYSGLYRSMTAPISLFTSKIVNSDIYYPVRTVIHEISHTWWGNVVSSNAEENYWLYEGFAKYSEIIGIKPVVGADIETLSFSRLKLTTTPYLDYVPSIRDAGKEDDRYLQITAAYHQGATFLRMLEYIMGKENFYQALRDYTNTCRQRCIDTDNFIRIMQKNCSEHIEGLLSNYLNTPGYARYTVNKLKIDKGKDYYLHTYEIRNVAYSEISPAGKEIHTELKVQSDLENYTQKLVLDINQSIDVQVKSTKEAGADTVIVDPEGVFPVWEYGLKGPGGMVYENNQGEVTFVNIVNRSPLAIAGVKNSMILLKVNGEDLMGNPPCPTGQSLHELNALLWRPTGTTLNCLVKKKDEAPYEVTIRY